jgi:NAD-dependent SIR2 family protein deacetylase
VAAVLSSRRTAARAQLDALVELAGNAATLTVLTGAGCSTASGIPDYRDAEGRWKHARPVLFRDFVGSADVRKRYWARSLVGWPRVRLAVPNAAHRALAALESRGHVDALITQNVDGLHRRAGSTRLIELHGRLGTVVCLACRASFSRDAIQRRLRRLNPDWTPAAGPAPDGDAHLRGSEALLECFSVPGCSNCGGVLKPDVVFFGEQVPKTRVDRAFVQVRRSSALLVVGSSLMVYSGYRFVREA